MNWRGKNQKTYNIKLTSVITTILPSGETAMHDATLEGPFKNTDINSALCARSLCGNCSS